MSWSHKGFPIFEPSFCSRPLEKCTVADPALRCQGSSPSSSLLCLLCLLCLLLLVLPPPAPLPPQRKLQHTCVPPTSAEASSRPPRGRGSSGSLPFLKAWQGQARRMPYGSRWGHPWQPSASGGHFSSPAESARASGGVNFSEQTRVHCTLTQRHAIVWAPAQRKRRPQEGPSGQPRWSFTPRPGFQNCQSRQKLGQQRKDLEADQGGQERGRQEVPGGLQSRPNRSSQLAKPKGASPPCACTSNAPVPPALVGGWGPSAF